MGFLSSMFGGTPKVTPAAPAPTVEDPEVEEAKRKEKELAMRRRGRQTTLLTSSQGVTDEKKTLLGQ